MIEQMSFLGLRLRTQSQRRRLVVLYYAFVLLMAVALLWKPHASMGSIIVQTLILGGLLGGIRAGGPVKPYAEPGLLEGAGMDDRVITLNLTNRSGRFALFSPLDEREQHERDFAHFLAYRLLRWTVGLAALVISFLGLSAPHWLGGHAAALLWVFVVYLLSLPQAVLLWRDAAPSATEEFVPTPFA